MSSDLVDTVTGGFDDTYNRLQTADHWALQVLLHVGYKVFLGRKARLDWIVRVRVQVLQIGCEEFIYRYSKRFQSMEQNVVLHELTLTRHVRGRGEGVFGTGHGASLPFEYNSFERPRIDRSI